MEDYSYNSLANQLLENGIISSNEGNYELNLSNGENFFEKVEEDNFPKTDIEEKQKTPQAPQTSYKRLNEYDSALIKNVSNPIEENFGDKLNIVKRFLEFKKTMLTKGKIGFIEYLEYKFFPKIYRAKLVKEAMNKLHSLNINANELLDKTIPYGENESRYDNLVKYLNYANELNTKLQKKF